MPLIPGSVSDPNVPGLGAALDLDSLFEILGSRLPECREGLALVEGRAMDVQYTPGEGAQVLWKIRAHDAATGRTGRQLIVARALGTHEPMPAEPTQLIERYRELRANKAMIREMPFLTPWLPVPEAHLVVYAFPLDPLMPSLMTVGSPASMRIALQRVWKARGSKVRRIRVDTLSYTPGARAAMQYEVLAEDRETTVPELRRLVGKLDVRRPPARLFAGHWAVWRRTFGQVSIAPPVGYVAVAQLSLQEFLTGTRLSDIESEGQLVGGVRQAARSLAKVHRLNLPLLRHRNIDKEMRSVERWSDVLTGLRPAQSARIETLGRRLREQLSARMRISATIHADFHLANILVDKHGVTLIDWDQVAHGDPMLDVGRFLASLRVTSLRINGTLAGLSAVEEAFLETYLRQSGDDEKRARLFEAASLLTAAAAPFRLQREGWQDYADLMIDEVERVLDLSQRGPQIAGTAVDFKRRIPFNDRPAWATDRVYAQALLVPIVHAAYGDDIELTECKPMVTEAGRSSLHMRWTIKGYKGDERWRQPIEAIGFPDTSGRSILQRLRSTYRIAGENPASLQTVRPLGLLSPLSLLAFEPAGGDALDKLLSTEREEAALTATAQALAAFQKLDIPLSRVREARRVIRPVVKLIKAFVRSNHGLSGQVGEMLVVITSLLAERDAHLTPALVPFTARQVRVDGARVTGSPVHDVLLTDPLYNPATLLTELALRALERGVGQSAVTHFRSTYLATSNESEHHLAAWEALLLLRAISVKAARDPHCKVLPAILESASSLVEKMAEAGVGEA